MGLSMSAEDDHRERDLIDLLAEGCASARLNHGAGLDPRPSGVVEAIDSILLAPEPLLGLETILDNGALESVLPEVHAIVDFHKSCPVHHKDLWTHTLEVMERSRPEVNLRWAVLLHDVGKIETRALDGSGRVSFHGHEELGGSIMRAVGARLHMTPERVERIAIIIERHGRINAYTPQWSDRAVRRLIRESGPFLDDLLSFSGSDYTTRRRARQRRIAATLEHLTDRIERLRREDLLAVVLPRGLGSAVARALDLPPGPEIGRVIQQIKRQIECGELERAASLEELVEAACRDQADLERIEQVEVNR